MTGGEPLSRKATSLLLLACLTLSAGLIGCRPEPNEPGEIRVGLLVDGGSSGQSDPEAIRRGLAEIEHFPGVTGEITYRGTGGDPQKQAAIVLLQEGKVRLHRLVQPEGAR